MGAQAARQAELDGLLAQRAAVQRRVEAAPTTIGSQVTSLFDGDFPDGFAAKEEMSYLSSVSLKTWEKLGAICNWTAAEVRHQVMMSAHTFCCFMDLRIFSMYRKPPFDLFDAQPLATNLAKLLGDSRESSETISSKL